MSCHLKSRTHSRQRGVALLFAILALFLLSAIAASLVLVTNTETSVNRNYRNERVADYAAKAGMEEVRGRMRPADPGSISAILPTTLPPNNGSILYLINQGTDPTPVQPWNNGSAYMDDELCHDAYAFNGQMQQQANLASDLRCTSVPNGNAWYATVPGGSNAPWSGTAATIPYKWVRVALKVNCTVQGAGAAYCVNAASAAGTQVCWNGATEVLLPAGTGNCQAMNPSANPVYVLTSMAVTGASTRKVVQAEVALNPAQPFPYGLYATGTACPPNAALNLNGGGNSNPFTDSFTTAGGGTYTTTNSPTGGDVGSNGGVALNGHGQVGGIVGVLNTGPNGPPCATGDYYVGGANAGLYNPGNAYPGNVLTQLPAPVTFPTPPDPTPLPPSTPYAGGSTLVPGTYGAITLTGDLTLSPGTYNIYSLNMSGKANIIVNPPGAVVLNFPSTSATPINFSGQSILSNTGLANDLLINYSGTGTINIAGQNASYFNLDAPLATVNVAGKGDVYGRIVGQTLNWSGNGKFHFDKNSALAPPNNGPYTLISFRDVSY